MLQNSKGFTLLWQQLCFWRILGVEIVIFKNSLQGNYYLIYHDVVVQAKKFCWNIRTSPIFLHFPRKSWKNLMINTNLGNLGGFSVISFPHPLENNVVNPLFWPEAGRNPKFLKCISSCSELSVPSYGFQNFHSIYEIFFNFKIFQNLCRQLKQGGLMS